MTGAQVVPGERWTPATLAAYDAFGATRGIVVVVDGGVFGRGLGRAAPLDGCTSQPRRERPPFVRRRLHDRALPQQS
jgi:hypothetical protein